MGVFFFFTHAHIHFLRPSRGDFKISRSDFKSCKDCTELLCALDLGNLARLSKLGNK